MKIDATPKIKMLPVNTLKEYELNAKKHSDEQIDGLAEMIQRFGFNAPIVIDKKKVIIAGHARLAAAKKLGMKEVPCVEKSDLTPDEVRAYRYLDNKIAEAPWDLEKLALDLPQIDFDFEPFKISLPSFAPSKTMKRETEDSQQFIIVVECRSEKEQKKVFEELQERGLECRLVM